MKVKINQDKKNFLLSILSGVIVALSITLILILLFALLVRFLNISDNFIFPINQVIKVISLFFGVIVALKKIKEKGLIAGLIIGIFYYIISFLMFSILQGAFTFGVNNLYDLILTTIMSGLIGIISINFIK